MDTNKTGEFISSLRKEKGLTQTELAQKLNISNRTVSKWENADGYPDITILPELSKILGVSVDELLNGEKAYEKENIPIKFEAVFKESKKEWQKTFKYTMDKVSKQGNSHIVVFLIGLLVYLIAKTNIFQIKYDFVNNIYKGLGIAFIIFALILVLYPIYTARVHLKSLKLRYNEIPRKRCVFSDKIYLEMGDDARGRMYYNYEDITSFIISEDIYVIIFNKRVYVYLPKSSIKSEEQNGFESLIASYCKDVYDTSSVKKRNKIFKALYIILIVITVAVFGTYHYITNPQYFYNNIYEKQQYYFDNKAEFNRGLENVENDKQLQKEVKNDGYAAYYGDKYITLDKIGDVDVTKLSVCFDSYYDEGDYYSGYVYYEGDGIPTPKDMNFEESEIDKAKQNYIEDEKVYLIGKEKNGAFTRNEWFLAVELEDNWYYCEFHA